MQGAIIARFTVSWRVLKHGGKAVIGLVVGWLITLLLVIRDNVLSDEQRKTFQFSNFIPHLSTWQWVAFGLVLALLFVLEGAYRLYREVSMASAPTQPTVDPFKEVRAIVQSLPADSEAKVEANTISPTGERSSLSVTLGGLAGTGNVTTLPAGNQPVAGVGKPPQGVEP